MRFSGILITRPRAEALELAGMLAGMPARPESPPPPSQARKSIILPAFEFKARGLPADEVRQLEQAAAKGPVLLIFTSPRSVDFGLGQIPPFVLKVSSLAAIGPATAEILRQAGAPPGLVSRHGYTSEDLLREIRRKSGLPASTDVARGTRAFIFAAPGGRETLREGLATLGFEPRMLMVYEREPAKLEPAAIEAIEQTESLLVVWSSANAMKELQRRLPVDCWNRVLRAEWLVISDRLAALAQSFNPARVHLAAGPSNAAIAHAIQALD